MMSTPTRVVVIDDHTSVREAAEGGRWPGLVLVASYPHTEAFLSRHLYKTYSGYVLSQFRRMANAHARTGAYKPKHAMHLVRLLYSGIEALRSGEIRIDVAEHRRELLAIKSGAWPFERAKAKALELDRQFQEAYRQTTLPEQPDYRRADEFLVWARRRMVDA